MDFSNYKWIVGCDEVGTGALAGPLVVCGVRAPPDWNLEGLNDSKKLTEKKRLIMRDKLSPLIENGEISFYLTERSNVQIDRMGMATALKEAYMEVFLKLFQGESLIIIDGILKFDTPGVRDYNMLSMIKADGQIPTVMAASILAKTYRDEKMKTFHLLHPEYNWIKNVGYGSRAHLCAINAVGASPLHRTSYAPIKKVLDEQE